MTISVTPHEFRFVKFDAGLIQRIGEHLVAVLDIDHPVQIEVDETTPLGRVRVTAGSTIDVHVQSGAFEDSRRPREQSEDATTASLGRALLRARDRLDGSFAQAPADDELSLRQVAAWDTYCAGRLARLGVTVHQQRWRYNFRNRHGFTDAADTAFEQLWSADSLTWDQLDAASAHGATAPVAT